MVQRTPVQIRIDEGRKRRWQEEAAESADWRSLTDLIVTSVEQILRHDHYAGAGSDVDLTSVHDRFDSVSEQLYDIEDRLDKTCFLVREDGEKRVREWIGLGHRLAENVDAKAEKRIQEQVEALAESLD